MAKRKPSKPDTPGREITTEIFKELLTGSQFGNPFGGRKRERRNVLKTDTGMVLQEFDSEPAVKPLSDPDNFATIVVHAAAAGFASIDREAPETMRLDIQLNPKTAERVIASLLMEMAREEGDKGTAIDGTAVSFSPDIAGCHKQQPAELIAELRQLGIERLVKIRDAAMILSTLLELRTAAREQRWHYVAACSWQLGKYMERAECRRHEPDAIRGKVTLNSARAGAICRRKLTDQQRASAIAERERMIKAGHSPHDANQLIGRKYGVSYKTIGRLKS